MKTIILLFSLAGVFISGSCSKKSSKSSGSDTIDCSSLPYTSVPQGLVGNWANGFTSFTNVYDVYTGKYLGSTWQSGRFFHFEADGRNAEMYYMGGAYTINSATKAQGTVEFDQGSTDQSGSFTFHTCKAHYNGWENGVQTVNRDATADECLSNGLTTKYYYRREQIAGNDWLRIEPGSEPTQYSFSFKQVD